MLPMLGMLVGWHLHLPPWLQALLAAAVLLGPEENQKFQGMRFIPGIADKDYHYVRKMYATIGQPQYADFVGN